MARIQNPPVFKVAPAPSGVAATDNASILAALEAVPAGGGVLSIDKEGVYTVNESFIRKAKVKIRIGPATTVKAVAGGTLNAATAVFTDIAEEKTEHGWIGGGGTIDANNVAGYAIYARYFGHMLFDVQLLNALVSEIRMGDPAAPAPSYEPYFGAAFYTGRSAGAVPVGGISVWASNCSDGRLPIGAVDKGQETGIKLDAGGWKLFGAHPYGAASKMQVCIDANASCEVFGPNLDTPTPAEHAAAAGTEASSVITDAAILPQHKTRPVTGANIPAGAYVGEVISGVSFELVNALGVAIKPTGIVAGITLIGAGIIFRASGFKLFGGDVYNSPTYGVDKGCVGAVIGPAVGVGTGTIMGFEGNGGSPAFRVLQSIVGNLAGARVSGIIEKNCFEAPSFFQLLEEINASLKELNTQAVPGFVRDTNGNVRLRGGYEASVNIAKEAKLFLLPAYARPSKGVKIEIKVSGTTAGAYLTIKSNGEVNISVELKEKETFSLDGKSFSTP